MNVQGGDHYDNLAQLLVQLSKADVRLTFFCPIIVFTRIDTILDLMTLSLTKLIPMVSKVIEWVWNNAVKVMVLYRPHDLELCLIFPVPFYSALIKFTLLSEYVTILQKPQAHNVRYLL